MRIKKKKNTLVFWLLMSNDPLIRIMSKTNNPAFPTVDKPDGQENASYNNRYLQAKKRNPLFN